MPSRKKGCTAVGDLYGLAAVNDLLVARGLVNAQTTPLRHEDDTKVFVLLHPRKGANSFRNGKNSFILLPRKLDLGEASSREQCHPIALWAGYPE